ncbi:DeoR/GlpR family DNA-binding transcription regulator [Mesobacillus maritimus]|uniref:DeoR/GlpR family DNA-binding transcription regulator n=1 Tax=Mesobacillus maritimus TaxID=1643336 RepID=UPI00203CDCA3|nr:DeoR/GlpR family DNA-binding transcription regulator [Mesobacillus maritimus]MCM3585347.1 DeoR/GlpR family DNA-binding transcription regulator [Mesobacillus maritimus]MCM3668229.1 DeoR/GlpR family DNA-binding transcription regulator [Mesobacillus maritimus]
MLKEKRIKQIEDYVVQHKSVSLDELVEVFNVSKNTIRRDVQELVESGNLKKVYGGVAVKEPSKLESFQERKVRNQPGKTAIGRQAVEYVEEGDVIFIDSGTTTIEMFNFIKDKQNITIVTNNIEFIVHSLPYENLNIITIGGILERKTNSLGRPQNLDVIKTYNINKAFMATTGISLSNGVTNASPLETDIKQAIVQRSQQVYLLADHQKFGRYGLMTYCNLEEIDYLITDKTPEEEFQIFAKNNNVELVIVD